VKVTVETDAVTQSKRLDATACTTFEDLRACVWEDCGHLLKGVKERQAILLCPPASPNGPDGGAAPWLMLTPASDVQQAIECGVLRLTERRLLSSEPAVAFVKSLAAPKPTEDSQRGGSTRKDTQACTQSGAGGDESDDGEDKPLLVDDSSEVSQGHGKCNSGGGSTSLPRGKAEGNASQRKRENGRLAMDIDDEQHAEHAEPDGWDDETLGSMVLYAGRRVRLNGLVGKQELNGAAGVIVGLDHAKQRYRVRLDPIRGQPSQMLAFKRSNITPV